MEELEKVRDYKEVLRLLIENREKWEVVKEMLKSVSPQVEDRAAQTDINS